MEVDHRKPDVELNNKVETWSNLFGIYLIQDSSQNPNIYHSSVNFGRRLAPDGKSNEGKITTWGREEKESLFVYEVTYDLNTIIRDATSEESKNFLKSAKETIPDSELTRKLEEYLNSSLD